MLRKTIGIALVALVWLRGHDAGAQVIVTTAQSKPITEGDLTIAAFDPTDAVAAVSIVEGPGWKVGEGTVVHPTVGIETGYVSNVFYTDTNPQGAGLMRVVGQIGTASLNGARLDANVPDTMDATNPNLGSFEYQTNARVAYDQLLSGNATVRDGGGGGLSAGFMFQGLTTPQQALSFGVEEYYERDLRAANYETTANDNRDLNTLRLTGLYHPPGRTLSGYIYYENDLDLFEQADDQYPDRMENRVGVHPMWRWFPQTTVYADVSEGVVTGVGNGLATQDKPTSYPLVARAGITTLLSLKTTLGVQGGYTNGFYSRGPSFSSPLVDGVATYRYSPLGRVGVSYDLLYTDSINANFFRDHVLRFFIEHAISPLVAMVEPELHFREYSGVTMGGPATRDDTIFAVRAGIHYTYRNWLAFVLDYKFSTVITSYRYTDSSGDVIDPAYSRHELLLGVRAAL